MAEDFGKGTSRTLSAKDRAFAAVAWNSDKPVLDSDLNLMAQIDLERLAQAVKAVMPSGFLMDPTRALDDFVCDPAWSNLFGLGNPATGETAPVLWAVVNGWVIPVAGTAVTVDGDVRNLVKLNPSPASNARTDLVVLEAWTALVKPNPSTVNKPDASHVWKWGNVQNGGATAANNPVDDIEDPQIGFEVTKRVQVQWRIRVIGSGTGQGASVPLDVYPDGLDWTGVQAQGAASLPVAGATFNFTNMGDAMGDPSLWRAGDGDPTNALGTTDGYSWAIPICAVFRRNLDTFKAFQTDLSAPNLNGGRNRNPLALHLANALTGAKALSVPTLQAAISWTTTGVVHLVGLASSGIDDTWQTLANMFLQIEDEIIGPLTAADAVAGTVTLPAGSRGRWNTAATAHAAGTQVTIFNPRPDGLYADQVALSDILDLRRAVTPGDWDFQRLLSHNVAALLTGKLHTAWKIASGGQAQGPRVLEVDVLDADSAVTSTFHDFLDGPDGIRTVWSDAATVQPDVTMLLDPTAAKIGGIVTNQFDGTATAVWDVGPDFVAKGFLNTFGAASADVWANGSVIFLHIGGSDGSHGARGTCRVQAPADRIVRFIAPREWADSINGLPAPLTLRFTKAAAMENVPVGAHVANGLDVVHPGPLRPWPLLKHERPFIVLGGVLHGDLAGGSGQVAGVAAAKLTHEVGNTQWEIEFPAAINFDTAGVFRSATTARTLNPADVSKPLLHGTRTLYDLLTDGGRDLSGASSDVYIVLWGDAASTNNNGVFKVIGAGTGIYGTGTDGYTNFTATHPTSVVVQPLSQDFAGFNSGDGTANIHFEFRSQVIRSDDPANATVGAPDLAIVLTDLSGAASDGATIDTSHPWNLTTLTNNSLNYITADLNNRKTVSGKLLVSMALQYGPGRGGFARVADRLRRLALVGANGAGGTYLRQSPATLDATFPGLTGMPSNETFFGAAHVQTWNRLSAKGQFAPDAPAYGGSVIGFTEQDRETELLVDVGSKTLIWRPLRFRQLTLQAQTQVFLPNVAKTLLLDKTYQAGALNGVTKDGGGLFTVGQQMGFPVPRELMPRFGRQDVPIYTDTTGTATFLPGLNHLFADSIDSGQTVFSLIGGADNGGNAGVGLLHFKTDVPANYGHYGTTVGSVNNLPCYDARKTTSISGNTQAGATILAALAGVHSSDLGPGLRGIQLPPCLGPARIIGVYEAVDFEAKGGRTVTANRWSVANDPATNLLKPGASAHTLHILQDGASDATGQTGDHTYIVTDHAIDVSRVPGWTADKTFKDYNYVVVASVFGFTKDWITRSNLVPARRHTGAGTLVADGDNPEAVGVRMVVPAPAGSNHQVHVDYDRSPYQGDPWGTRNGEVRAFGDSQIRYGQVALDKAFNLATPLAQYDANGVPSIQRPNPRTFEVLASMDFHTSLGTGRIGGAVWPATPTDVGFLATGSSRIPSAADAPAWQTMPRTFTAAQPPTAPRASATIEMLDLSGANPILTVADAFLIGKLPAAYVSSNETHFEIAQRRVPSWGSGNPLYYKVINQAVAQVAANGFQEITVAGQTGLAVGDGVEITASAGVAAGLVFSGRVSAADTLLIRVSNTTDAVVNAFNVTLTVFISKLENDPIGTARNLAARINVHSGAKGQVLAEAGYTGVVTVRAVRPGAIGNSISATVVDQNIFNLSSGAFQHQHVVHLSGGLDVPASAGAGDGQISLLGMTGRLPLGFLVQDSDFMGENPLGDVSSAMSIGSGTLTPVLSALPLAANGKEYDRSLGEPGGLVAMCDGAILTDASDGERFRLARGGGAAWVMSGDVPGGPLDWTAGSFPASAKPVLKGAILACRALLVRNFPEVALNSNSVTSRGGEVQMLVLTQAIYGDSHTVDSGVRMSGILSPTGYGEGYAAADRFRIDGRPMVKPRARKVPDPAATVLASYPTKKRT